jgi:hypothetical protein
MEHIRAHGNEKPVASTEPLQSWARGLVSVRLELRFGTLHIAGAPLRVALDPPCGETEDDCYDDERR